MTAPTDPTHQARWVLLSASADHPTTYAQPQLSDADLLDARHRHGLDPHNLLQSQPKPRPRWRHPATALILTGELRCLNRSQALLQRLAQQADLFVVTTEAFASAAHQLTSARKVTVLEDNPSELAIDQSLPVGSMKQWHKLALGLQQVQGAEARRGRRYSHVVKLRSDYFYVHPERMLQEIGAALQPPGAGLVGASDKVFAGSRDHMMLLQGFFHALEAWFDGHESDYWPINLQQVLASDEALKWYGMNWPVDLIGEPESTESWRERLIAGGPDLAQALARFQANGATRYHRLFQGHPRFASEVCFARFLNLMGLPFRDCRSLRGFLYSDRSTCR